MAPTRGKGRGTATALSSPCGQQQGSGEVKGSPVRRRGPDRRHWCTQRGSDHQHQGDEHLPRALLVPKRGDDHGH
jgi:hypothetical protein